MTSGPGDISGMQFGTRAAPASSHGAIAPFSILPKPVPHTSDALSELWPVLRHHPGRCAGWEPGQRLLLGTVPGGGTSEAAAVTSYPNYAD